MAKNLVNSRPKKQRHTHHVRSNSRSGTSRKKTLPAVSLAAALQLQEQQRELLYSLIALSMKVGLLTIGIVSVLKLGLASHQRFRRFAELSSIIDVESVKLINLQKRFDRLYTIGGDRRLMEEQDQWIAPNRVRVIWR